MPDTPIWLTKLREVGMSASDPDALAAALDSVTDPRVIRTLIRLDLDDLLPASCDRPLGVLVGTPGPWEDIFNEEMLRMAVEFGAGYPPARLLAFHRHCERHRLPYEVW